MKTCTKCGETKPISEFGNHSSTRDKLRPDCKVCAKAYNAKYYVANAEHIKATVARWKKSNPEKKKIIAFKWYTANPEKYIAYKVKYRAKNLESARAAGRVYAHTRRARKRGAGGKLSKGLAERLFKLQKGKCTCGCLQALGTDYHLDHVMPIALGGTNTDDNMQLLRAICNQQKHAKHPIDFMQQRGFLL